MIAIKLYTLQNAKYISIIWGTLIPKVNVRIRLDNRDVVFWWYPSRRQGVQEQFKKYNSLVGKEKDVNKQVKKDTHDMIKKLFGPGSFSNAVLVIFNTIYFKEAWKDTFEKSINMTTMKKNCRTRKKVYLKPFSEVRKNVIQFQRTELVKNHEES